MWSGRIIHHKPKGIFFILSLAFNFCFFLLEGFILCMQKLADYIGLPCRIARGCKYCVADHRSSCLVKIEDRQLVRFDTFK